jgi:predicted phage terminase large subunit-like protein
MYLKKNTEKDWRNNFGGVRYATSTGGTVTGKHADVILRDDPLNPVQAASETERTNCNRYNDRTLSTRKKAKDRTLTVTVMQRLHEDDTTGHDLKKLGKKIFHICLPAELSAKTKALPEEVNKYYVNNLLDPTRLSKKILEAEYAEMRSYAYAGQYLQKPYPDEDGLVERNWFVYIDKSEIPRTLIWDLWIDGAYTDNKSANDPTGLMMCAWDMLNERLVVRHCKSDWLKFPELVKLIPEYYAEHGGDVTSTIYIEPKASGHDLINMIADETNITVVKIKGKLVEQGKAVRVNYAAPRIEAGKVHIVRDNWNEEFVTQLVAFPNYSHDEYCDLLGYALQKYINS